MSKAAKKQRHKAKRDAKKREMRRNNSISPIKRLADAPGDIEYWMSNDFQSKGQTQIFVYKRAASLSGIACFLVDRGVVGLKDAWIKMDVEREDFRRMIDASRDRGIEMNRVKLEDIRKMVAGGIRWAQENGMRLPKDWPRTASLIGGVGDWTSADVSEFEMEFVGHPEDLRQRLVSEPFDSFIRRPEIRFLLADAAPYMDQESGKYVHDHDDRFHGRNAGWDDEDSDEDDSDDDDDFKADELPEEQILDMEQRFAPLAIELASGTATWLAARGAKPSPKLVAGWHALIFAHLMSITAMPAGPAKAVAQFGASLIDALKARALRRGDTEYRHAVQQAVDHLQSDPSMIRRATAKLGIFQATDQPAAATPR